ncbi:MAG: DUF4168 domain-containing protein [Pseudomonadales bacterium]
MNLTNKLHKGFAFTCASALALLLSATSVPAYAEEEQQQPFPEEQVESLEVTDEQLEKFVDAVNSVEEVQQDYAAQIQAAEDVDKAQDLRQEAQEEMVTAVEESGLSVDEFNLIAQQIQTDPALVARLQTILRE